MNDFRIITFSSIERLSDGEIFNIGDAVCSKYANKRYARPFIHIIDRFKILDNGDLWINENKLFLEDIMHEKPNYYKKENLLLLLINA